MFQSEQYQPATARSERHRDLRLRGILSALSITLLSVVGNSARAANQDVTWGFGPTPTQVSIQVNDTVTWNGNLGFHPLQVTNSTFTLAGPVVSSGGDSYARTFTAPGTYYFRCELHGSSMPTTVTVTCGPTPPVLAVLDIDGNGQVDATTDGLLTLRYLLGLRGSALTAGALGVCASRDTAAIETYLAARVVP